MVPPPPAAPSTREIETLTVSPVGWYGTTLTVNVCVPSKAGIDATSGSALLEDWVNAACDPSVLVTAPL